MKACEIVPLFYTLIQLVYASNVDNLRSNALQHRENQDVYLKKGENPENATIIISQVPLATVHITITVTTSPTKHPSNGVASPSMQHSASNMPAGTGIAQPPSMPAPTINSATLALDPLIGGGSSDQTSGNLSISSTLMNGGGSSTGVANTAGLKTAGILLNTQPPSEATAGIPQPPSPVGAQAAINSATLATAKIVGGSGGVAAVTGGSAPANSTGKGVPGAGNALSFGKFFYRGGFLGSVAVLLL